MLSSIVQMKESSQVSTNILQAIQQPQLGCLSISYRFLSSESLAITIQKQKPQDESNLIFFC
jgi:hypothetical protein